MRMDQLQVEVVVTGVGLWVFEYVRDGFWKMRMGCYV